MAYRDMRDQILGVMRANKDILGPIAPYTYDVVTSGVAGVKGVNALKLTTSMGWPWCKSKSQFMSRGDPVLPEYPDGVIDFDDPKIMEDIEWCKNEYREGRRCGLVFRACLKDEPTKIGKKKVRLFTSSNIILSVLCRQYFLPIARIIAQYPLLFYTAVGMNCYSTDWCLVRGLVAIFGAERVFAGDFKKYDKRLEYQAQILMWVLLRDCGEILGYPEEALRIMNGIMEDIARPIWETNGEFLIKETDNSSGHDMTVVINGLANWLQMGYSFYKKVPDFLEPEVFQNRVALYFSTVMPELDWSFMEELDKEPLLPQLSGRFSKYVSLITLGDDNALGVSEKAKWFDHIAVSDALSEVGLDYTDADKNTPTVGFQGIDNISFLKRKFVMHEDIGRIVAPIEEASIWKSLFCWKKTSEVPWEQHCADQINGALREFALYGEEVFERRRAEFVKIAEKHDIMHYFPMNKPFTYRELLGWYADM